MGESYFNYILSKCRKRPIGKVCQRYQLPLHLERSVKADWIKYNGVTDDSELMRAISHLIRKENLVRGCDFAGDSWALYNRCYDSFFDIDQKWKNKHGLNYDDLFDVIVDLCWLLASIQHSEYEGKRYVKLLSNLNQIRDSIKDYLEEHYKMALTSNYDSECMGEAIAAKTEHPFFTFRYDYKYQDSEQYIERGYTKRELEDLKDEAECYCKRCLTIYYELTITCGMANVMIRGL